VKCVVVYRVSREDYVPRLLIVELACIGWFTPWFSPPHVEKVFNVNPCVTYVCACVYISSAYLLVKTMLKVFT
jgi:hypothetical protein